jgi:hypothetical protein
MSGHGLTAFWTVQETIARTLTAREDDPKRTLFAGAHRIDDQREPVHVDQHAVAALATEQRMALESTVRKGCATDRARTRRLAQQLQVFDSCWRLDLGAAMAANEKTGFTVEP